MDDSKDLDSVDGILAQWRQERPDLDVEAMGTIGRLKRCATLLSRKLDEAFVSFDLTSWEFDVLATLRRSGAPYCLAPTALFGALMITSGTMTQRLKGLESRGLVTRVANTQDARSLLVQLSKTGLELIDRAVTAHVANEQRILAAIKPKELMALDQRLSQLLQLLEATEQS
jgi:DNA-binding MarR family transcriptional regulator